MLHLRPRAITTFCSACLLHSRASKSSARSVQVAVKLSSILLNHEVLAGSLDCGIAAFGCQGPLDLGAKRKSRRRRSITAGGVLSRCCITVDAALPKSPVADLANVSSASAFPASSLTPGQILADTRARVGGEDYHRDRPERALPSPWQKSLAPPGASRDLESLPRKNPPAMPAGLGFLFRKPVDQ
jgi:hypothetical protein